MSREKEYKKLKEVIKATKYYWPKDKIQLKLCIMSCSMMRIDTFSGIESNFNIKPFRVRKLQKSLKMLEIIIGEEADLDCVAWSKCVWAGINTVNKNLNAMT